MTVATTLTLSSLRAAKTAAIGNPLAKLQLVRDQVFVSQLIHLLHVDTSAVTAKTPQDALRIEAAHLISSLSYGSEEVLGILLCAHAHHALIYALSHFSPEASPTLRTAFARALRALMSSIADVVGPSLWGLRAETYAIRNESQQALDYLFQVETLDVFLPLLIPAPEVPSTAAVLTSIAQMLGTTIRTSMHRRAVTEWLPPADRQKEIRPRRGWESSTSSWILKQLLALLSTQERDYKLIEAILSAIASLAKENSPVADNLDKPFQDDLPLMTILNFTKSRSLDVQLAACLCLTNALRSSSSFLQAHSSSHLFSTFGSIAPSFIQASPSSINISALHSTCSRTVMNIVNCIVSTPLPTVFTAASTSNAESPQLKIKACFILHQLVSDDGTLCQTAFERGCLEHVASLIKNIAPIEPAPPEWEEDEPESMAQLREAAITCLASLALCSDDIRRRITDELRLLPHISRALRAKRHVGTRYAACQCVRAVSRAVAVLRTGIVDSGLGMDVLRIVLGKELGDRFGGATSTVSKSNGEAFESRIGRVEEQKDTPVVGDDFKMDTSENGTNLGEDARVLCVALSAVCNIVNDFSPLRPIYLEEQLMPRLVYLIKESGDPALRLNALWAVKNLIRKTSTETKRDLMSHLGWQDLLSYLSDPMPDIQEQGFNILRNLAENEEGTAMVFREIPEVLVKLVEGMRSPIEDVVLQSTYALANLANGTHEQQDMIVTHPHLLSTLQMCLAEGNAAVRRPAVSCILALVEANPKRRKEMSEAGIVRTLRSLCEWSGHSPSQPPHESYHVGHGHSSSISGIGSHQTGDEPLSVSNVSSGVSTPWAARSTVRSFVGLHAGGVLGGTYGSWAGTGSLHHYHSTGRYGEGRTGSQHVQLHRDDERDVIQRAHEALGWLEYAESYPNPNS